MATCSSTRIGRTRCTGNGWPWRVPRRAPAGSAGPCGCRGRSSPTPRRIGSNRDPQVLGQVASQTRPEGASNARRTWVYVERCWRPRTKYGEANWPSTLRLTFQGGRSSMAIKQVGVIGCGLMGSGIAQVSAQAGFPTVVIEANQGFLDKGLAGIRKSLEAQVAKARMEARAKD